MAEKQLFEWPADDMSFIGPDRKMEYSPAREICFQVYSDDGTRCFVRLPGEAKFQVIDGTSGEVLATVNVPAQRVPFNQEWGEKQFAQFAESMTQRNPKMLLVKKFPEFFPQTSVMQWSADGRLVVLQFFHGEAFAQNQWSFDGDGKSAETLFDKGWGQVRAIRGEMAYLTTFDPENEAAGLRLMPVSEVATHMENFIKAMKAAAEIE